MKSNAITQQSIEILEKKSKSMVSFIHFTDIDENWKPVTLLSFSLFHHFFFFFSSNHPVRNWFENFESIKSLGKKKTRKLFDCDVTLLSIELQCELCICEAIRHLLFVKWLSKYKLVEVPRFIKLERWILDIAFTWPKVSKERWWRRWMGVTWFDCSQLFYSYTVDYFSLFCHV